MGRWTRLTAAAVMVAATGTQLGATAWADDVVHARRFPSQTLAYFSCSNVDELKTRLAGTSFGDMLGDQDFRPFLDQFQGKLDQVSKEVVEETGFSMQQLLDIPQGEATFAVVVTADRELAAVGLMDFGDNEETVNSLIGKVEAQATKSGAERRTQMHKDVEIVIHDVKPAVTNDDEADDNAPADNPAEKFAPTSIAYFVHDSHIVISHSVPTLTDMINRWDGTQDQSLADNQYYAKIMELCREEALPQVTWFVDPIGLVQFGISAVRDTLPQAQMALGFLPILGVDKFKGVGGVGYVDIGKYESLSRTYSYVTPPPIGVMGVFQFPAVEMSPPAWASADVSSYSCWNWDVQGAYTAVENLFNMFQGPGAMKRVVDGLAKQPDGPNVNIKDDVVDNLTGRITAVSYPGELPEYETPTLERLSAAQGVIVIAAEVKDAEAAETLLAEMAEAPSFPGRVREIGEVTVYELPVQGPAAVEDAPNMGLAVIGNELVYATDVALVERIINEPRAEASLAESESYKTLFEEVPKKTSVMAFQKPADQLRAIYEMVRSGEGDFDVEEVDLTTLPPFTSVEKYLRPSISYAVPAGNGMLWVQYMLKD